MVNLKDEDGRTPLHIALEQPGLDSNIIKLLLEHLGKDLDIEYTSVQGSNYLHIAAKARSIDAFLFVYKKSIESDVYLLEYNEDHENPLHLAAKTGILPSVVKGIFEHLDSSEKVTKEKLEDFKSYVKEALCNRCALDKSKRTPLDWVSKTVRKKIKETAGIKDSFICNQKFRLCLYIVGAIACIAALCLSLYFLFLVSQSLALASMAGIISGGAAYLSAKVFGEIHDLHDVSTPMEVVSTDSLFSNKEIGGSVL